MEIRHPKPVVPRTLVLLFSASLAYLVLYVALISLLNNASMYEHITDSEQQRWNAEILAQLNHPFTTLKTPMEYLTPAEHSHIMDVKRVFGGIFIIAVIAAGIMLGIIGTFAYLKMWNRLDELLGRSLRAAGWTILGIALFLVLAAVLNFERFWVLFHLILFPQGNWLFARSTALITLYPNMFFERFVLRWLLYITTFGIAAVALSYFLEHMRRHEAFFEQKAHKPGHTKKK